MSERLLGAIVGMHGDDSGLIMPPSIAPIQVVLCPMIRKNATADTISVANEIASTLRKSGLRVKVDNRDLHPGQKYYDWEIKGVPLRLDIGPRDIEQGTAFAAKRTGGKEPIPLSNIANDCLRLLQQVSEELRERAHQHMEHVIQPLPQISKVEGEWTFEGEILDGHIYEW